MKLSWLPSISKRSFHVSLRCSRLSQLVHWPCLDSDPAFAHLAASSCCQISATTNFLLRVVVALFHVGQLVLIPNAPLPYYTWTTIAPCLRVDFACCTASNGIHFLPVASLGAATQIVSSRELVRVMFSLTLVHLHSSVRLEFQGTVAILYKPILLRQWGRPSQDQRAIH